MSLQGEINKYAGDIRRAVNQMGMSGMLGMDGSVRGTKKIFGYVCAIHDDGDLKGTIDVQEFGYEPDEYPTPGAGHHEGVLLSAIQDNKDGVLIVPMLYSEVVIVQNPTDKQEYVLMYSHAREVRIASHSLEGEDDGKVEIGVTEVEKFSESDDGLEKDYDELEPTKNKTNTIYTAKSITDQVASKDDEEGLKQEKTAEHKVITVGDTKITIDGKNVNIETSAQVSFTIGDTKITNDKSSVKINTKTCEVKGTDVTINGQNVTITGGNLKTQGTCTPDMNGPYNGIKACPFSGAPHCGSQVSGT